MPDARVEWVDRLVRWTTTASVVVLAGIAAVISYKHMFVLVHRYGETSWTAALFPVSVDGMIVTSSMSLLASSRLGERSGMLPWALLMIGSAASLAANVAVAEPSAIGRLIAAWPSAALIGSYELLMRQIRQASARGTARRKAAGSSAVSASYERSDQAHTGSHADAGTEKAPSDGLENGSYDAHTGRVEPSIRDAYEQGISWRGSGEPGLAGGRRRSVSGLQRQAWQWAQANRTPTGELPTGKTIAERFGRRERWGRLVKQTGSSEDGPSSPHKGR